VHVTRGRDLLARVAQQVSDIARVDEEPKAKGKVLQMLLVPTQS
jgi:translation initiation factor IF-3